MNVFKYLTGSMDNWVHIIGIAGVTTSGVAAMFRQLGWKVTGSDKGFYPPVSTFLAEQEIEVMPGFKPERLTVDGRHPDLVVFQGTKGSSNKEYTEALRLGLTVKTYPAVLQEYVINPARSIVVAGTYGKTTTTAAVAAILSHAGNNPGWMFGGLSTDGTLPVMQGGKQSYSVVEGDEYLISTDDRRSKFLLYSPVYLVLTAMQWDHPDLFPTKESYLDAFTGLISQVPAEGLIVANAADIHIVEAVKNAACRVVFYAADHTTAHAKPDWILMRGSKPLPSFVRDTDSPEIIPYERKLIGEFNEENLLAAGALAYELGIRKERIQEAISKFSGIRRRLEVRFENEHTVIIDDFGSSPPKARGALHAVRTDYPDAYIAAVFEPNTGNRVAASLSEYKDAFADADAVYFPRFTRLPKSDTIHMDESELAEA
ncbi:MAG: UDP-N-acetylmuramate:L-alanyl-gamma-D-glutamyl-meso-diaminopimelate ligase [candidate division WS6 bacterium OLB20]|uniref:UDP-N-acetylmuramate:L-alanyl-gamma-D-glutamyl-meso-diaminopimelate ligase n=1 Tax=candidate division WS6 bacterium OLB20 TaxID=1617426 RepID=A0A136M0Q3_9BACT|nr:MAG: UDP-N-acetylmuramate:L-alanyl-gamma-D-glutamyl-meso-diaminopimelate ligase [candidate division WS6 bacterium OLB20]